MSQFRHSKGVCNTNATPRSAHILALAVVGSDEDALTDVVCSSLLDDDDEDDDIRVNTYIIHYMNETVGLMIYALEYVTKMCKRTHHYPQTNSHKHEHRCSLTSATKELREAFRYTGKASNDESSLSPTPSPSTALPLPLMSLLLLGACPWCPPVLRLHRRRETGSGQCSDVSHRCRLREFSHQPAPTATSPCTSASVASRLLALDPSVS